MNAEINSSRGIYFLVNAEKTEVVPTASTLLLPSVFVRLAETADKDDKCIRFKPSVRNTLSMHQHISSAISASWISSWIFFSRVNQLSVLTLISVSVILQNCRWQIAAKHTGTLRKWLRIKWHCKVAHSGMVTPTGLLRTNKVLRFTNSLDKLQKYVPTFTVMIGSRSTYPLLQSRRKDEQSGGVYKQSW